ncbi:MAG: hypothetical protein AB7O88_28505 [Reyranellaceae bacterium]
MSKEVADVGISDVTIDAEGAVLIATTAGTLRIRKADAVETLTKLLLGIARASEKPGPAYRMMVQPIGLALERVGAPPLTPVPCLDLELEAETHLRIALRPEWLLPLAENLKGLDQVVRQQAN